MPIHTIFIIYLGQIFHCKIVFIQQYVDSLYLFLLTLDFFANMNSLNWAFPSGRKSKTGRGVGTSAAGEATCFKRGSEERSSSPLVGASSGSSGQRHEQLPPHLARASLTGKSILSSLESSDSMFHYLEAFKTSLGGISQGKWNTLEGLADEDSMGAVTQATMMVRHLLAHYACIFYLVLGLIRNFLSSWQATLYSLKSLNINATNIASYDKLKADFDEAINKKTRQAPSSH